MRAKTEFRIDFAMCHAGAKSLTGDFVEKHTDEFTIERPDSRLILVARGGRHTLCAVIRD